MSPSLRRETVATGHSFRTTHLFLSSSHPTRPKRASLQGTTREELPPEKGSVFSVRVVKYWNTLPVSIVTAFSVNILKKRLDKVWTKDFPHPPIGWHACGALERDWGQATDGAQLLQTLIFPPLSICIKPYNSHPIPVQVRCRHTVYHKELQLASAFPGPEAERFSSTKLSEWCTFISLTSKLWSTGTR